MRTPSVLAFAAAAAVAFPLAAAPATPAAPAAMVVARATSAAYGDVDRATFNRLAAELYLPLFWRADQDGDQAIDPDEVATLWGIPGDGYVSAGAFTPKWTEAYGKILARKTFKETDKRKKLVVDELAQGRPTLVENDFSKASVQDKAIVQHVLAAAQLIERIYAKQTGVAGLVDQIPADDTASRALFFRNQGPWCTQPRTEKEKACGALAKMPEHAYGLYPASLQKGSAKFCEKLETHPDEKTLLSPFVVVKEKAPGQYEAVPYTTEYADEMQAISKELKAAADAIKTPDEAAFKAYLAAAAKAFTDNQWEPADEAWSKMSVANSKWYLRIGPDETYFEPCSRKAGFHVSFARINQDSLAWQKKLEPVKGDMEKALAALAGPPYQARDVSFHLPDFIDIVLNAGDSRDAAGATIGQSLPNWGPVANEGRGRTVAMTNLYTDDDSKQALNDQVASLFCAETMASFSPDAKLMTGSTVLHEAAHNLGPAHEYKVDGKTDDQIFTGEIASMLEELKSQTAALYFTSWLVQKGLLDAETAKKTHYRDVTWAFGHIAQGMYNSEKKLKAYSALAAIQVGHLYKEGALVWDGKAKAANGTDTGCLRIDDAKLGPAIDSLASTVLKIKGSGDQKGALALKKQFVDGKDAWGKLRDTTIRERWLRAPKASFVYAVR
jgi:hypothetical protein